MDAPGKMRRILDKDPFGYKFSKPYQKVHKRIRDLEVELSKVRNTANKQKEYWESEIAKKEAEIILLKHKLEKYER